MLYRSPNYFSACTINIERGPYLLGAGFILEWGSLPNVIRNPISGTQPVVSDCLSPELRERAIAAVTSVRESVSAESRCGHPFSTHCALYEEREADGDGAVGRWRVSQSAEVVLHWFRDDRKSVHGGR
jgi:hypothetical protein